MVFHHLAAATQIWRRHPCSGHFSRISAQDACPDPFVAPFLWVIVATVSAPLMLALRVIAAPDWPAGVYFHGDDVYRVGIIVARELPRDRSTLLVRIMAAGPGLADAIADLAALPVDAHERAVAEQIVLHLQDALARKPSRTPEEEELVVRMYRTWEEERQLALAKGRKEGRAEEAAQNLLTVLEVRGFVVPDSARERILGQKDLKRLERWLAKAVLAASVGEVIGEPS